MLLAMTALLTASVAKQPQAPATGIAGPVSQDQPKNSATPSATARRRKIPCKTLENASLCYWTHGRLWYQSWNFTWLLWKIGTHHLFKICDEPVFLSMESTGDCWDPEFPANLKSTYAVDRRRWERSGGQGEYYPPEVFGDFEICPLEPERAGWRQYACIESAKITYVDQ